MSPSSPRGHACAVGLATRQLSEPYQANAAFGDSAYQCPDAVEMINSIW